MDACGNTRVLIIEDDPAIQRFLCNTLRVQEYDVREARTAAEGLFLIRETKPEIVILDLGLPDMDGMDMIKQVRACLPVPILVLSARDDESGKVTALDAGADDYVTKPFGVDELMARMRTALRHRLASESSPAVFVTGGLVVDLTHRLVSVDGREIKLSRKEYDILSELAFHCGKVLTHRHLLKVAWGSENAVDVQYLRVYIRQIRQKIEKSPEQPAYIVTEPGVGYRLMIEASTRLMTGSPGPDADIEPRGGQASKIRPLR